jgi:hypothetical protein
MKVKAGCGSRSETLLMPSAVCTAFHLQNESPPEMAKADTVIANNKA